MAFEIMAMTPMFMVFDMQTSLDFYCNILGFELVEQAGPEGDIGWVMLRKNNTWLMLNTQYEMPERPEREDPAKIAAHANTCLYFMCADADEVYQELYAKKIADHKPSVAPYGMKQLYIKDPDGYHLCFQSAISQ